MHPAAFIRKIVTSEPYAVPDSRHGVPFLTLLLSPALPARSFVEGKFAPHGASTIGASFMVKKLTVGSVKLTMQIWDTAGQERFRSMAPMYYRGAAAAVLVLDWWFPLSHSFQKAFVFILLLRPGGQC